LRQSGPQRQFLCPIQLTPKWCRGFPARYQETRVDWQQASQLGCLDETLCRRVQAIAARMSSANPQTGVKSLFDKCFPSLRLADLPYV
jgi:hypothetical protein